MPEQKERAAAEGDSEKADYFTDMVAVQMPALYEYIQKMVNDILEKRHPHFNEIWSLELNQEKIFIKLHLQIFSW